MNTKDIVTTYIEKVWNCGDLVAQDWEQMDSLGMLGQLGVLPT